MCSDVHVHSCPLHGDGIARLLNGEVIIYWIVVRESDSDV